MENMERRDAGFRFSDISLAFQCRQLLRRFWIVVAAALFISLFACGVSRMRYDERYEAELTCAVTGQDHDKAAGWAAGLAELLGTDAAQQRIREEAGDRTLGISAKQISQTNVLVIRIAADTPEQALNGGFALENLLKSFCSYISEEMTGKILRQDVAQEPTARWLPWKTCILGAVAGALAAVLLLCRYDVLKGAVQTRSYARRVLAWTPLAVLPPKRGRFLARYQSGLNEICVHMEHSRKRNGRKVFLFAGSVTGEGCTSLAAETAKVLAARGRKVVLVDANLRSPGIERLFDITAEQPATVERLLSDGADGEGNLFRCENTGVHVLPAGGGEADVLRKLTGAEGVALLRHLGTQFDYVLVDAPPLTEYADGEALAAGADEAVLIIRQGMTPAAQLQKVGAALETSGCVVLGYVLNDFLQSPQTGDPHSVPPLDVVCLAWQCVRQLRRSWILFAVMAALIGGMFGIAAFRSKQIVYETTTVLSLYARPDAGEADAASLKMAAAFPQLILTGWMRDGVKLVLNRELAADAIMAQTVKNTNIVTLTVRADSPEAAREEMAACLAVYPQIAAHTAPEPRILVRQEAGEPTECVLGQSVPARTALGILLGLGVSACAVGGYGAFMQPLQSSRQLEDLLGVDVMTAESGNRETVEALVLRVQKLCCGEAGNVFALAAAGDAAHEMAAVLGTAFAETGFKTVLVDCGQPALHSFFGGSADGRSLQHCLKSPEELEKCLKSTSVARLMYLSGEEIPNFVCEDDALETVLQQLRNRFDFVILDATGLHGPAAAQQFLHGSCSVLLTARQDEASVFRIREFADSLADWEIQPKLGVFWHG